ncbi:hypothetical protein TNCT_569181 [Trichonephila clavata]|uniref:Uncharacterized protein n=1 Tax=Trichonephila clavata TaxID=2740835 RepID=A0A8X6LCI3_TRICU|nr:hypothetical protein TNCT_569181 [Trichonephila clavata]
MDETSVMADGHVDNGVVKAFMEVSWLERSVERETGTVTESSDGVASYVLLSVRAPGSMFGVQVAGDEDAILVPEELVKILRK